MQRPRKKKAKHVAAKEARAVEAQEEEHGGYALVHKGALRADGVFLPVAAPGEEGRTCLPDALFAMLRALWPRLVLTLEEARTKAAKQGSRQRETGNGGPEPGA